VKQEKARLSRKQRRNSREADIIEHYKYGIIRRGPARRRIKVHVLSSAFLGSMARRNADNGASNALAYEDRKEISHVMAIIKLSDKQMVASKFQAPEAHHLRLSSPPAALSIRVSRIRLRVPAISLWRK